MQNIKLKLKYSIRANTLMELMVAMVILAVCMTLSSVVYINIQKGTKSFFKLKAINIAEIYLSKKDNQDYENELSRYDNFYVSKKVKQYKNGPLNEVSVIVFDQNKVKLIELKRLME